MLSTESPANAPSISTYLGVDSRRDARQCTQSACDRFVNLRGDQRGPQQPLFADEALGIGTART